MSSHMAPVSPRGHNSGGNKVEATGLFWLSLGSDTLLLLQYPISHSLFSVVGILHEGEVCLPFLFMSTGLLQLQVTENTIHADLKCKRTYWLKQWKVQWSVHG